MRSFKEGRRLAAAVLAGMALCAGSTFEAEGAGKPALVKLSKQDIDSYSKLSPFELKNTLIELAQTSADALRPKGSVLNAGRGNPNFVNTTAREAYALLTLFSAQTAKERSGVQDLGFRPEKAGIAEKLTAFLKGSEPNGSSFSLNAR